MTIDALRFPGAFVGCILGLVLASIFRWLTPVEMDTTLAGAWFIGWGCALGLVWEAAFGRPTE